MTPEYFHVLFDYTHSMNERCINALLVHEEAVPEQAHALMCHILNAHEIWIERIAGREPVVKPWDKHLVENYAIMNNRNHERILELLTDQDTRRIVEYTNSVGQSFSNTVEDILFHVVNHGTHHRAQIAVLMRSIGLRPPVTDFIAYKRQ